MTRNEVISRIQKLQKFTTQNGCTEHEALRAAEAIARLVDEHQLSETELRREQSTCRNGTDGYVGPTQWAITTPAIGRLFSVVIYTESDNISIGGLSMPVTRLHAFGYPTDVEAALAMTQLCYTAIATETEQWRKNHKGQALSFRTGMAARLKQRIYDLIPRRNSTALIPLKNQLVKQEFAKTGVYLRSATHSTARDRNAFAAGQAAANRVALNREARIGSTKRIGQ